MRTKIAARAIAAGLVALLAGCGQDGGPPAEYTVEVAATHPVVATVEDTLSAVGTIEPDERVVLQPETSGLIESIHFEEGQRVRKGDILFRLRSSKEEAQLAQVMAEMRLARANLERARMLAGTKAISEQELDQMESELAAREAAFELESRRLDERVIRAPFDGVLGPREISVGQYVNAGTPLATLVQDATVEVTFTIPERQFALLHLGQAGRVRVSAFPDRVFSGKVDLIDPEVNPTTRTVRARLVVDNPEGLLRPGMFARVELVVGRRDDALVVPESALVPSLGDFHVFVVREERARRVPVEIGVRLPGKVELRKGVDRSDLVIISGTQKLVDGTKVLPTEDVARDMAHAPGAVVGSHAAPGAGGEAPTP